MAKWLLIFEVQRVIKSGFKYLTIKIGQFHKVILNQDGLNIKLQNTACK